MSISLINVPFQDSTVAFTATFSAVEVGSGCKAWLPRYYNGKTPQRLITGLVVYAETYYGSYIGQLSSAWPIVSEIGSFFLLQYAGFYLVVSFLLVPMCHCRFRNRSIAHGKVVLLLSRIGVVDLCWSYVPRFCQSRSPT